MHQRWDKLLFLHWRVPVEEIRPKIPARLEIDTFDGSAWIGVTPFTMSNVRPSFFPAIPLVSESHELNVRTYVHADGVPGVWFFSLDASNPLAVIGARFAFALPYYSAYQTLEAAEQSVHFYSRRIHPGANYADFDARWTINEPTGEALPDTLEFFLVERYCLYASRGDSVFRCRIHHRPWPLRNAELASLSSSMIQSHRIAVSSDQPLLHAQSSAIDVEVWPLERI